MGRSKRNIPRSLSSPNAAASFTSPNKYIKLFLSPDKPSRDSKGGFQVKNVGGENGRNIQDSEKQVPANRITPQMLEAFRSGWHDRSFSTNYWRVRVNN